MEKHHKKEKVVYLNVGYFALWTLKTNYKDMTDTKTITVPSSEEDLNSRVRGFNEEMIPLLKKYRLGLGATASLTPDGRVIAKASLFDDTPSPALENVLGDDPEENEEVTPA